MPVDQMITSKFNLCAMAKLLARVDAMVPLPHAQKIDMSSLKHTGVLVKEESFKEQSMPSSCLRCQKAKLQHQTVCCDRVVANTFPIHHLNLAL